jgi:hypothetical protein
MKSKSENNNLLDTATVDTTSAEYQRTMKLLRVNNHRKGPGRHNIFEHPRLEPMTRERRIWAKLYVATEEAEAVKKPRKPRTKKEATHASDT